MGVIVRCYNCKLTVYNLNLSLAQMKDIVRKVRYKCYCGSKDVAIKELSSKIYNEEVLPAIRDQEFSCTIITKITNQPIRDFLHRIKSKFFRL